MVLVRHGENNPSFPPGGDPGFQGVADPFFNR
jgi:hypothetical protein